MRRKLLTALAPAALALAWAAGGSSSFAQTPSQTQQTQSAQQPAQQPQQPQPRTAPPASEAAAPRPTRPLPPDVSDHNSMTGAGSTRTYPNLPVSRPDR